MRASGRTPAGSSSHPATRRPPEMRRRWSSDSPATTSSRRPGAPARLQRRSTPTRTSRPQRETRRMDERARRIGRNEALFRKVNEEIEGLTREVADFTRQPMRVICECGSLACAEQLSVSIGEYERVRRDPTLFFVKPGHELPDVESTVEETPEFMIVRKDAGDPAQYAR